MKRVYSNGKRNEKQLSEEQKRECLAYIDKLGFKCDVFFSEYVNTSFSSTVEGECICYLVIGTDVYPGESPHTANEKITYKGTIAHEIYGHYLAWKGGYECESICIDEAQASIRAARFAPDLSCEERIYLLRDGLTRLKNGHMMLSEARQYMNIETR